MHSEIVTLVKILQHKQSVSHLLQEIASRLEKRANTHDDSKFNLDEFEGFCQMDNARLYEYGSPEYEEKIHTNNAAQLHVSRNRHHPEYWPNGIADMNMIDIIEMLCDWEIARQMRDIEQDTEKTWAMREKRFGLSEQEVLFLRTVWDKLKDNLSVDSET